MTVLSGAGARTTAIRLLADSARLQRSVLEALDGGVIVIDPRGALMQANRAAATILGFDLSGADADPDWWRAIARRTGRSARMRARAS